MKERGILFSAPMVLAILEGRKTQTRRQVGVNHIFQVTNWINENDKLSLCPYGQPGDRLWVRETYYQFGHWEPVPGVTTKSGRQKWRFVPDSDAISFDEPKDYRLGRHHKDPSTAAWHKRLGRFMPRKYSRIVRENVSVRVERLNDISNEDAMAEGLICDEFPFGGKYEKRFGLAVWPRHAFSRSPSFAYQVLWESINGPGSWAKNPWVWVVEFKRV